ncbi:MAG: ABC transporter permease [Oligoflexales bacterium]
MPRYIIKRILGIFPVLWVVATLTFFLIRLAPGGPFDSDKQIPAEILANLEAKYHLDEPLLNQYFRYLGMLAQGDLGPSFRYASRSVNEIIVETFPVSVAIGFAGLVFALFLGLIAGMLAASKPNSLRDYLPMFASMLGICLPSFVIGPLLMLVFSIKLGWFNVSGWDEPRDIVLPALTLGTMYAAFFARLTRGGILDIIRQDFVRTAHAKGLRPWLVMVKHCLKGGLLPSVSFLGPAVTAMLTGSSVVETIFNIPGLGRFFVQSALNRDYTLVMGCVLFVAFIIVVMNLLVDIAYALLDPRVSYD